MSNLLAGPIALSCVAVFSVCGFFIYYGSLRLPLYVSFAQLCLVTLALVQVFAILPYDVAVNTFGADKIEASKLTLVFEVLYWVSFAFGWVIMPVFTSMLNYNYALSMKKKIWYAIQYNLVFWFWAGIAATIGVFLLLASGDIRPGDIIPLTIALSNAYGLVLMCLLLGYGLVSLPKHVWHISDPAIRIKKYLHDICTESSNVAKALVNARLTLTACESAKREVRAYQRKVFVPSLLPRIDKLNQLIEGTYLTDRTYINMKDADKTYSDMQFINWEEMYTTKLESFLKDTDNAIRALKESSAYLTNASNEAEIALFSLVQQKSNKCFGFTKLAVFRSFAVLLGIMSLICLWGEIALMINPRLSLFNYIYSLGLDPIVSMVCVTAPIIGFILFVVGWSLTRMQLWNYYRFITDGTSEDTFYYWVSLFCRVAPTVAYHFLLQIGGQKCVIYSTLNVMDRVAFFGNSWNIFSPIIMILVALSVWFGVWNKMVSFFGIKKFSFDEPEQNIEDVEKGKQILCTYRPELSEVFSLTEEFTPKSYLSIDLSEPLI